ncbi:hypothetical protein LTR85_000959 [Meristemomyces frigidus]|nr:hypothetical protein LTR85_000959 [Meristemomyces frigidus]
MARKRTTRPKAATTGPDRLNAHPPELLQSLLDFLAGNNEERYISSKTSLRNLAKTCKSLQSIVQPELYHSMVLSFNLDNEIPEQSEIPMHWRRPKLLDFVEQKPELANLVEKVQIRIEPFPVQQWSEAEVERVLDRVDTVRKLRAHADAVVDSHTSRLRKRTVPHRQDGKQTLTLEKISVAYAQSLVLTSLAATAVRDIRLRCIAAPARDSVGRQYSPYGTYPNDLYPGSLVQQSLNELHIQLPALSGHLAVLRIDVSGLGGFPLPAGSDPELTPAGDALRYWRHAIENLTSVTTLGLRHDSGGSDRPVGTSPPYLGALFAELAMSSVTSLELEGWILTVPLLRDALKRSFTSLSRLRLEGCTMHSATEQGWFDAMVLLRAESGRGLTVNVHRPRYCVVGSYAMKTLGPELLVALQRHLG